MRHVIAHFPSTARGTEPEPPGLPALTINPFAAISGAPLIGNEWSTGEARLIHDGGTNDLAWIVGSDSDANWRLFTSQDLGAAWSLSHTLTTGGGSTYPNRLLAIDQDSAGEIHAIAKHVGGSDQFAVLRFSVTRASGHMTALGIAQAPFTLADHNHASFDHRGTIKMVQRDGVECVLWSYACAADTAGDTWTQYAGVSTSRTPASASDFTGLGGSGTETAVYTYAGDDFGHQHRSEIHWAQLGSTEDLYMSKGRINSDHRSPEGADSDQDLTVTRWVASGGNWTQGSTTVIATDDGTVPPMLLDMKATANYVYIMYYDPAAGIKFARINAAGTVSTSAIASPDTTTGRAAFGAFSVSEDDANIWAIWQTYWLNADLQPEGGYAHWDDSWHITADEAAADCNGIATTANWRAGIAAIRWTGDLIPQNQDFVHAAVVHGAGS